MALVLAIEPDLRQAGILTRIVREKVKADVVIVDSRDAAMEAMRSAVPDVMLLSALLSPRDEDELVAHLRTLEGAEHLQTHTIPQLASAGGDGPSGPARGLLKAFLRRKDTQPAAAAGCDPDLFAQEIRLYLDQAEQKRKERAEERRYRPDAPARVIAAAAPEAKLAADGPQTAAAAPASWDSPFEWRRSEITPAPFSSFQEEPAAGAPAVDAIVPPAENVESIVNAQPLEPSSLEQPPLEQSLEPADLEPAWQHQIDPAPEPAPDPVIAADRLLEAREHAETPELFETFVPAPVAQPESFAPEPIAASFDLPPFEPPVEVESSIPAEPIFHASAEGAPLVDPSAEAVAEADVPAMTPPEPIEAYGHSAVPEIEYPHDTLDEIQRMFATVQSEPEGATTPEQDVVTSATPRVVPAPDDPLAIDCFIDAEAIEPDAADAMPAPIAVEAAAESDAAVEQPIDLSWADVQQDLQAEAIATASGDEEEAPGPTPARRAPPKLGPLATWARLERKSSEDERRAGSDMREIIERLAVPAHIAGVSYARGVRIRRVRVAGTRDRRRPADKSGPVILSRRALAQTRSTGPSA